MTQPIATTDRIALNALIDGELDEAQRAALETRLAAEPTLREARDQIAATRDAVATLPRPEPSADFLRRIEALAEPAPTPAALRGRWDEWRRLAAAIVLTGITASGTTWFVATPNAPPFEQQAAASHRRSLLAETPVDVRSSDRHTVKPWLDARIGISPPAPDLAAQGYKLVGGRVDVIGEQAVPTLVYRHNEHVISVFAIPGSASTKAPRTLAAAGYNMVEWSANGFNFTATSDLEPDELASFVADYRAATRPG